MPKPKRPAETPQAEPVLTGNCFATFLNEARSIGNEVAARREYDKLVAAFLTEKGLFEEFAKWLEAKRGG